jgi:hypothetical protein
MPPEIASRLSHRCYKGIPGGTPLNVPPDSWSPERLPYLYIAFILPHELGSVVEGPPPEIATA